MQTEQNPNSIEKIPQVTEQDLAPLTEDEAARLRELYRVDNFDPNAELAEIQAAGETEVSVEEESSAEVMSLNEKLNQLEEFSEDPTEFASFLENNLGQSYQDSMAGEIIIKQNHLYSVKEIALELGQAVDLMRQYGSMTENVSQIVDTALYQVATLPRSMQKTYGTICRKYWDKKQKEILG